MKKKLIAILLAATCALTAGLTGCSGNAAKAVRMKARLPTHRAQATAQPRAML